MPDFVFAYHGGRKPETPEEGETLMARWGAWIEGLGEAMVNPGQPVGKSWTVSASGVADNGGPNPLTGYSIVSAASIESAIDIAKTCPFLEMGTIEVAEAFEM